MAKITDGMSDTQKIAFELPFLIEDALDEYSVHGGPFTRERAVADAILARFDLVAKQEPFRVGQTISTKDEIDLLPHLAVLVQAGGTVIQVSDLGSVATDDDAYDPREYRSPFWCVRVYDIAGLLPLEIKWLPKQGQVATHE